MWSDNETTDDLFGFRVHADMLRELILDPEVLPATIGVYGDWGGGKSSIMQMLRADFEGDKAQEQSGVAILYFNGWLFEGYDDAKAALLSSILTALRDHKRFGPKIAAKATELLRRVNIMRGLKVLFAGAAAGALAIATGGLGAAAIPAIAAGAYAGVKSTAADAAKAAVDDEERGKEEALTDIRVFRDDFAKMLAASDIKTLVVLIDDLDRCSPERIIENLEAIKLFLNVPNTAFVIGADRRIIRQAVAWRYRDALRASSLADGQADPSERLVDDYLEKLIQIPYRLPRLSPSEIQTYLTLLFCRRHLSPELFTRVHEAAIAHKNKDRYTSFAEAEALEAIKPALPNPLLSLYLRIGAGIASQITDVLQGNPRQVKRFLNAFVFRRKLAQVAKLPDVKDDVLVKLMLLEYADAKLFDRFFAGMDGQTGIVGLLAELEPRRGKDGELTEVAAEELKEWAPVRRWLAAEPFLASVDLRDYMWVSRDRLGTSMSTTVMVPTAVKASIKMCLGDLSDKAGLDGIKKLSGPERAIMAAQLVTIAKKAPATVKAFRALLEIAKLDESAAQDFKSLIQRLPKSELPPALAVQIKTHSQDRTPIGAVCSAIVAEFGADKSSFGKALKQ